MINDDIVSIGTKRDLEAQTRISISRQKTSFRIVNRDSFGTRAGEYTPTSLHPKRQRHLDGDEALEIEMNAV
jgi:hypothetical protein